MENETKFLLEHVTSRLHNYVGIEYTVASGTNPSRGCIVTIKIDAPNVDMLKEISLSMSGRHTFEVDKYTIIMQTYIYNQDFHLEPMPY